MWRIDYSSRQSYSIVGQQKQLMQLVASYQRKIMEKADNDSLSMTWVNI